MAPRVLRMITLSLCTIVLKMAQYWFRPGTLSFLSNPKSKFMQTRTEKQSNLNQSLISHHSRRTHISVSLRNMDFNYYGEKQEICPRNQATILSLLLQKYRRKNRRVKRRLGDVEEPEFELDPDIIPIGSARDGLKVDKADEFDYMLVIGEHIELEDIEKHEVTQDVERMRRELGPERRVLRGCYPIISATDPVSGSSKEASTDPTIEYWPGLYVNYEVHSAVAAREALSQDVAELVRAVNEGEIKLPYVTRIEGPVIGNPAIKIVLHKTAFEPNKVSIDITPTIRSLGKDQVQTKYYIAKRKHSFKRIPDAEDDPRYDMLWLESDSPYEKELIDAKKQYEIKNLKLMKSLFKNDVTHTHIWKKIFLSQSKPFPKYQPRFMEFFIDTFIGWLKVEMADRKHRGSTRFDQVKSPSKNDLRLVAKFNELENILERYKDKEILKWYKKFGKLSRLLHKNNLAKFKWKTIGEEELGEMGKKAYAGKFTNSDSETEEDSDSDLEKQEFQLEITDFYKVYNDQ